MGAATTDLGRNQIYHLLHHEEIIARVKKWEEDNPERARKNACNKAKAWRGRNPDKLPAATNPEGERARLARVDKAKRIEAINALGGPVCVKCGYDKDVRALHIDHIKGGGRADRKSVKGSPYNFYRRVIQLGRSVYQVLCANCNTIKGIEERAQRDSKRAKES